MVINNNNEEGEENSNLTFHLNQDYSCHILNIWCITMRSEVAQSCAVLCNPTDCSLPGKSTGVGCHFLLQGTWGLNPCLLHLQADTLSSEPPRKPKVKVKVIQSRPTICNPIDYTVHGILQARILEWVAFPFSRGSSQPRNWTQVSHIAGGFFTSWATREANYELLALL